MYEKRKSSWLKHIDFILLDAICLELAYLLAFRLRNIVIVWSGRDPGGAQIGLATANIHMIVAALLLIIDLLMVLARQPYKNILRRGYLVEFVNVCVHSTLVQGILLVYLYITQDAQDMSRAVFVLTWVLSIVIMYGARSIWKEHVRKHLEENGKLPCIIIVAPRMEAEQLIQEIHDRKYNEFQLNGVVLLDESAVGGNVLGESIVADEDTMFDYCLTNVVDAVLISNNIEVDKRDQYIRHFLAMGQTVHVNLDTITAELPNKLVQKLGGLTVLTTSIKTVDERLMMIKRLMDIISGIIGCLITLVVAVPLAVAVKMQSPGPLFFKQVRVGKNGRKFNLYKFRSMYTDAEERKAELMKQNEMQGLMFKMENDPRIFPVGRFIRKYSIDELPQFYNILKGDMSLVGTRPPTVDEYEQYDQHHKIRLSIKPGLTGLWQVSGRSNIKDFDEVVRLDEQYIENWSLGLDCRIILKTVRVVLGGDGSM